MSNPLHSNSNLPVKQNPSTSVIQDNTHSAIHNNENISGNLGLNASNLSPGPIKEGPLPPPIKSKTDQENKNPNPATATVKAPIVGAKQTIFTDSAKNKFQLQDSNNVTSLQRSYLFTNNDRYTKEQQIMVKINNIFSFKFIIVTFEIRRRTFRLNENNLRRKS